MLLEQLKALSDPTRLTLLAVLYQYELTVNELVSVLAMGQSRISRHLKIMIDGELIHNRRDGLFMYYYYSPSKECEICEMLSERISLYLTDEIRSRCELALEERRERTRHFFNSIADQWTDLKHSILGDFDLHGQVLAMLNRYSIDTVADLGCGNGDLSEKLAARYSGVIGVDNSPEMIRLAQSRFSDPNGEPDFRIGAIEHLPMRDEEVDCAVLILVLHHLSDPQAGLKEIYRTIRDNKYMVLVDFDRHKNRSIHEKYGDRWPGFSREELGTLFNESGFETLDYSGYALSKDLKLHIYLTQKKSNLLAKETT